VAHKGSQRTFSAAIQRVSSALCTRKHDVDSGSLSRD
jgi:hypothetical protein